MRQLKSYPCKPLAKYPGLRPNDEALWDALLISNPNIFDEVWYNVKLGDPVREEDDRETMLAVGMYDVCCWTIDVLGRKKDQLYVVEIKPDAKANAIGQALSYRVLFLDEYQPALPVMPVVLTDDISPITLKAAQALGVSILTP